MGNFIGLTLDRDSGGTTVMINVDNIEYIEDGHVSFTGGDSVRVTENMWEIYKRILTLIFLLASQETDDTTACDCGECSAN